MIKIERITAEEIIRKDARPIVCFGAGKDFIRFCHDNDITDRMCLVADNYKFGELLKIDGREIQIHSFIDSIKITDCIHIISTRRYAKDIIKQLDKIKEFDNDIFYIIDMGFFYNDAEFSDTVSIQEFKSADQIIPKKIHYFWFGKKSLPDDFKRNIESWYRYCPDYEICLWNEDNYDIEKKCYMKQAYQAKKWGFVSDYARLDIVNKYGGIYLDTDVELVKPLDDLLYFKLYFGFESVQQVNTGQGFGSAGKAPILEEMMTMYDNAKFIEDDGSLNLVPCPVYQTKVLKKHGLVLNGKTQGTSEFVVFSPQFFSSINGLGIGSACKNTYSIHKYAATWYDNEQRINRECDAINAKCILNRINNVNSEG